MNFKQNIYAWVCFGVWAAGIYSGAEDPSHWLAAAIVILALGDDK